MKRAEPRRHARGFGLLEAIVALALLASTGVVLFDWLNQNLQTATRLSQTEARARLTLSAQALMAKINPSERPEGSLSAGGLTVGWRAVAVEPERANATLMRESTGPWVVCLYRLAVKAQTADGTEVSFSQLQTGTRRIRPAEKVL